jgi:hypothetical protein
MQKALLREEGENGKYYDERSVSVEFQIKYFCAIIFSVIIINKKP